MSSSSYINDSDVEEYRKLFKARFGKDIDKTDARSQLSKLVRQMEIIYQPISKEQFDEYPSKNKLADKAE